MKLLVVSNLYPPHVLVGYEILCHQRLRLPRVYVRSAAASSSSRRRSRAVESGR